jgi:hypothetical protein
MRFSKSLQNKFVDVVLFLKTKNGGPSDFQHTIPSCVLENIFWCREFSKNPSDENLQLHFEAVNFQSDSSRI